ncbi:MAG: tetratricopeptide repeat protein [candidate division NC10 bacterium]
MRSTSQGQADAQFRLGFMYYDGQGVPQNYAEAVNWYRMAASQGQADAQLGLGIMYHNGQVVPQDYVQAHLWFNLAAAQGNEDARKNRDTTAGMMTPAQIVEAQRLAREWRPKKQ